MWPQPPPRPTRYATPNDKPLTLPVSLYADRRRADWLIPETPPWPCSHPVSGPSAAPGAHQPPQKRRSAVRAGSRCPPWVLLLCLADAGRSGAAPSYRPPLIPIQKKRCRPRLKYTSPRLAATFSGQLQLVGGCRPRSRRLSRI